MRCEACDFDTVTKNSTYLDTSGRREHSKRAKENTSLGSGAVVIDKITNRYLCSSCRSLSRTYTKGNTGSLGYGLNEVKNDAYYERRLKEIEALRGRNKRKSLNRD